MKFAEVYLWGTKVGTLHLGDNEVFADFEYDKEFIQFARARDIELSPIKMPISNRVYRFTDIGDAFKGVPGLIADSLPDKFGNAVISSWLAAQGKSESDFNVIDRLCYTGARGMGALEYVPAVGPDTVHDEKIDVDEMVKFASAVLNKRKDIVLDADKDMSYAQLLQLGTSAGGARAKAIIAWNEETKEIRSGQIEAGDGFDYWLIKFDGVGKNGDHGLEDSAQYTLIEYAYHQMAKEAGIDMEECRILSENGRNHFMTKRFDRVNGQRLHMQTLGALGHIDYNVPGLCSYEQAAMYMNEMHLGISDVERLFKRMVFNVVAVNQDDHVKNISFLMDRSGRWSLSPAYDITFSYNPDNRWLKAHQMTINGKSINITREDIFAAGRNMGVKDSTIKNVIEQIRSVVNRWEHYAEVNHINEKSYRMVQDIIDQNMI
ncbi:type II toxin-antitoxin system HipA family toxin [Butyrivibrio sp. XPD2002]|uniref:type II toxin-antitoxin system HipA family toxin n=1 Tax=Butyrivibrio sp. XPD2002 TaxID=1280665 RepID=UPI0003FE315E|nr:type II toxin-antitoxin system HipA family toxin [Butyrivibrio sp. XPD2002]